MAKHPLKSLISFAPQQPDYSTALGVAYCVDSLLLLRSLPTGSIDLVITSPPFALLRQKEYGNADQDQYIQWLCDFAIEVKRILRESGSFVLDLGGAYQRGKPIRSLYNFKIPIIFCETLGFFLAEEFFWHNPSKLPSPIEWVNKRKVRAKDTVNTVWWFSVSENPKSDITQVLTPYSERMLKLLENPEKYYAAKKRPSGHDISMGFSKNNGGALPSNLLSFPNSESNSHYLSQCKTAGIKAHPARFPAALPEFFIKMLTRPGDIVLDIFAGSNTTGEASERLNRPWISAEINPEYVKASKFRFLSGQPTLFNRGLDAR